MNSTDISANLLRETMNEAIKEAIQKRVDEHNVEEKRKYERCISNMINDAKLGKSCTSCEVLSDEYVTMLKCKGFIVESAVEKVDFCIGGNIYYEDHDILNVSWY
jgi:hypothetical protein